MGKRYRNGWWLEQKYHEEGMTQAEIADECDVSPRAIRKWMTCQGVDTRELCGENHPHYGTERPKKVREKISETLEGREHSEETLSRLSEAGTGRVLSTTTRAKISRSLTGMERPPETRRKMSEARTGDSNPNWKGGHARSYGPGWTAARREVRDDRDACERCGHDGSERRLEVHHIVPVRLFDRSPAHSLSQAHVRGNLVLLCRFCHVDAEYGRIEVTPDVEYELPEEPSNRDW